MVIPTIGKISILTLVLYFVAYIIIHFFIGKFKIGFEKELEQKPGNKELELQTRWVKRVFNWFPALYVVFVVAMLYATG